MTSPSQAHESPPYGAIVHEVVTPIYRLGLDEHNQEVLFDGRRILLWDLNLEELDLAELAGWDRFDFKIRGDAGAEVGSLDIPYDTRNATSVLSGVEAWTGEKEAIVVRAEEYLAGMFERYGTFPPSFSWDKVGITPDHHVFIAPPHLEPFHADQNRQQEKIDELATLLKDDEQNTELAQRFATRVQELSNG